MKPTEYHVPAGVIDVEHLGARCEARCHRVEAHISALRRAAKRLRRAEQDRVRRLAMENFERFAARRER